MKPNIPKIDVNNHKKKAQWYNKRTKREIEFEDGKTVLFQGKKNSDLIRGTIMEKESTPRSYLVKDKNEVVHRKNAFHLKKTKYNNLKDDEIINQKYAEQFSGGISIRSKPKRL